MNDINNIHYILENIIKNSTDPKLVEIAKRWIELNKSYIDEVNKYVCQSFFGSDWESELLAEQGISV